MEKLRVVTVTKVNHSYAAGITNERTNERTKGTGRPRRRVTRGGDSVGERWMLLRAPSIFRQAPSSVCGFLLPTALPIPLLRCANPSRRTMFTGSRLLHLAVSSCCPASAAAAVRRRCRPLCGRSRCRGRCRPFPLTSAPARRPAAAVREGGRVDRVRALVACWKKGQGGPS